jgi:hypothetical protein
MPIFIKPYVQTFTGKSAREEYIMFSSLPVAVVLVIWLVLQVAQKIK